MPSIAYLFIMLHVCLCTLYLCFLCISWLPQQYISLPLLLIEVSHSLRPCKLSLLMYLKLAGNTRLTFGPFPLIISTTSLCSCATTSQLPPWSPQSHCVSVVRQNEFAVSSARRGLLQSLCEYFLSTENRSPPG